MPNAWDWGWDEAACIFIVGLGGASALPLASLAQQPGRSYRLGFLAPSGRSDPPIVGFFDELRRGGWIEGQNLIVIPGGLGLRLEQVAEFAAPLVKLAPDVIVCDARAAHVLKRLTHTIPIVTMGEDIFADGLVNSLARPGGNITGISILSPDLDGKRQELLIEAVPQARHIAALVDANVAHLQRLQKFKDAARSRGVELSLIAVKTQDEIGSAIDGAKTAIISLAAKHNLPAIYPYRFFTEVGGLFPTATTSGQLAAPPTYVDRILRGAKLATARANAGQIRARDQSKNRQGARPRLCRSLLARADEVIE